jgi:hypothetical protein
MMRDAEQGGHEQQLEVARTVQCRGYRRVARGPVNVVPGLRGHERAVLERHPPQEHS